MASNTKTVVRKNAVAAKYERERLKIRAYIRDAVALRSVYYYDQAGELQVRSATYLENLFS